jgi:hypothetical protein
MKGMSIKIARLAVLLACSTVALAGCGKKSDQPAASKGQVVARVGEEVVTIQDLENEFRWANVTPDKQKEPEIVKRVLGELVVRKYLLRQAMAAKLDREPGVLLDLLRSREQILEKAYLQRTAAAKAPGKLDVDRYIANNPAKFAGRKLLSVELPHGRQMAALNSGDLPPEFYGLIEAKKADDVFFVRAGQNGIFFKVKGEEPRPLDGEPAANLARQLMRADAVKAELGIAAYSANIEAKYEGEYAKIMQPADGKKN